MLRDFNNWQDFPAVPATPWPRQFSHPFDAAINRYAERFLSVIMAGAPYFYLALLLAYFALCIGIIS